MLPSNTSHQLVFSNYKFGAYALASKVGVPFGSRNVVLIDYSEKCLRFFVDSSESVLMLFNSIVFLFFLPLVFLLYWFVFKPLKWQNSLVVVASYVFYGWLDWRLLILIAFTTLCRVINGLLIEHYEDDRKKQKWISAANIVLN